MIAWLMTNWLTQLAAFGFACWLARGIWKATTRPRLVCVDASIVKSQGTFLTVKRQELLPPWRTLDEVWLISGELYFTAVREGDGYRLYTGDSELWFWERSLVQRLRGLQELKKARDAETDLLSKPEARPN